MKTNKTPIQEFKCSFIEQFSPLARSFESTTFSYEYIKILDLINESLEKEKQFAFDCFQAGNRFGMDVCGSFDCGQHPTKPDFDEFYSQYVPQHNK